MTDAAESLMRNDSLSPADLVDAVIERSVATDPADGFTSPDSSGARALGGAVAALRSDQRARRFLLRELTAGANRVQALFRLDLGWPGDDDAARQRIRKRAAAAWSALTKDRPRPAEITEATWDLAQALAALRAPLETRLKALTRTQERTAATLPAWPALSPIRGFGPLGFAQIVGIAGDLGAFPGPRYLRKFLGMAPPDAYRRDDGAALVPRQTKAIVLYELVEPLLRTNRGAYRALYRFERERQTLLRPEFDRGGGRVSLQCDRRARRVVGQRLITDVWLAWHGCADPFDDPARLGLGNLDSLFHTDQSGGASEDAP